ncbi:VanZ family protein [Cohnella sp. 56]|uniref:VanZ family protein n=1 Tax=Cohnella sp. 56 TaxID=3113722 RepID=UPI0030EAC306
MYLLPMLAWLSLIFDFSSQTYTQQSIIPFMQKHIQEHRLQQAVPNVTIRYNHSEIRAKTDPYKFVEFIFRKGAHLFMYFMLGLFAHLALLPWVKRLMLRVPLALLIVAVFASLDEWNQSFTGDRTPTPLDVLVDLSGAAIGQIVLLIAIAIWLRVRRPRSGHIYS